MFKLNQATLDITEITNPDIRRVLEEFTSYHEMGQNTYMELSVFEIYEFLDAEDEELKNGWYALLNEMNKANIFKFTLMYWW